MSRDAEATDHELPGFDYLPGARGYAVLTLGLDSDGTESLAVWRLGPTGSATGAWVFALDAIDEGSGISAQVMASLQGRCLVDWTTDRPAQALRRIKSVIPGRLAD